MKTKRSYRHWSCDEVLRIVRELHGKGVRLNSGYISRRCPALAYAGRKYLGGWQETIEAAGYDYSRIRRKSFWSRPRIVERIRELHSAGARLNLSLAERRYSGLVGAAAIHYGSWRAAVEAAGFDYRGIRLQKEWTKAHIISEIRRMHRAGMSVSTTMVVRRRYRVLHAAAVRYFGTWVAAVRGAGLARFLRR